MAMPPKGSADYLALGDWNISCSMCGRKRKASEVVKNWQGMWRCPQHNEPRHPQEYVRAVPDIQTPPWTQPDPADVFAPFCEPFGISAVADYAVADCAICDFVNPISGLPSALPLVIDQLTIPDGKVGVLYSFQMTATGGSWSYTWGGITPSSIYVLPYGLIQGFPDTAGVFTFYVQVTDLVTSAVVSKTFHPTILP